MTVAAVTVWTKHKMSNGHKGNNTKQLTNCSEWRELYPVYWYEAIH